MTTRDETEAKWLAAATRFRAWVETRGVIVDEVFDEKAFGNRLIDGIVDGWTVRLVCDRDILGTSIGGFGDWHITRNPVAFIAGLSPAEAVESGEPALETLFGNWERIVAVLADPAFAVYEDAISEAFMARLTGKHDRTHASAAA